MTCPYLRRLTPAVLVLATAGFTAALAQDKAPTADATKGSQIVNGICVACHGTDGNSAASANPKVAGQHYEYLVKQLVDYSKPATDKTARVNPIMLGFASQLSMQDKRDVAAYFASQTMKPGTARNKDTLDLGQRIFRAGIPAKGVPACAGCHSPNGAGVPAQYPRLGGQWAEYTAVQLKAFSEGTRRNNVAMMQIASRLSEAEMKAVADYIAGLR